MSRHAPSALCLLALLAGCTDTEPLPPELTSVTPSRIRSVEAVTLRLEGQRLFPRIGVDFNAAEGTSTSGSPAVVLRSGGEDVALELISHEGPTAMEVRVPAGVAEGNHDVVLTDAWGRSATLASGLRVLHDCESEEGPFVGESCDGTDSDRCSDDTWSCAGLELVCSVGTDDVEVCDGVDNDCDPATPDGAAEPTLGDACEGDDGDLCSDDLIQCAGAAGLLCSSGATEVDLCDGEDNDCNPATADGDGEPTLGDGCDGDDGDLCSDDALVCNGGALACSSGTANAEICDGVDNDCDPATADGAHEATLGDACEGADADLCQDVGEQIVCNGSAGLACAVTGDNADLCDGADNDCRPETEDGAHEPTLGDPCEGPDADNCIDSGEVMACSSGVFACASTPDNQELCDGVDNDCRTATADGAHEPTLGNACEGPDTDACIDPGEELICGGAGGLTCAVTPNNQELCDGADNDCRTETVDGEHEADFGDPCENAAEGDLCVDPGEVRVCNGAGGMACALTADNLDVCDGSNNDCDPASPDGSEESGYDDICDGPDLDVCDDDRMVCTTGGLACAAGGDNQELCDGTDNDCDGDPDDDGVDEPGFGAACDGDDGDLCLDDVRICSGSLPLACSSGPTNAELCDGADNDCDGSLADDGTGEANYGLPCDSTADADTCADGVWVCNGAGLECNDGPTSECGVTFDVGEFVQPGSTGTTTVSHSLGAAPKALFIWTTGNTGFFPQNHFVASLGVVDESLANRVSVTSRVGSSSQTWRGMANRAIQMFGASGSVVAEASVTGWNASSFTVNWSVASEGTGRRFQFLAITGPQVESKLLGWQMPTSGNAQVSVTGAGFAPSAALVIHGAHGLSGTLPVSASHAALGLGVVTSGGQFSTTVGSADAADPTQSRRLQSASECLTTIDTSGNAAARAGCTLGSDGLTANFSSFAPNPGHVTTLALSGVQARALCFEKLNTTGNQTVPNFGFQPEALLLITDNGATGTGVENDMRLSIGGSTASEDYVSALEEPTAQNSPSPYSVSANTDAYVEVVSSLVTERADVSSFNSDGFVLAWDTNTSTAGQLCAVAFATPP